MRKINNKDHFNKKVESRQSNYKKKIIKEKKEKRLIQDAIKSANRLREEIRQKQEINNSLMIIHGKKEMNMNS